MSDIYGTRGPEDPTGFEPAPVRVKTLLSEDAGAGNVLRSLIEKDATPTNALAKKGILAQILGNIPEDYKKGAHEAREAGGWLQEEAIKNILSGTVGRTYLGLGQGALAPVVGVSEPISGILKAVTKGLGRIGPGVEHAAEVATLLNPDTALIKGAAAMPAAVRLAKMWEKTHELSGVPKAEADAIIALNKDKGLIFDEEKSAANLRQKLVRGTKEDPAGGPGERVVVKAPPGTDLPDFVTGRITPEDWIARHEKLLSHEEIHDAAQWYDKVYGEFLRHTKGDDAAAKKYMRAWLVAQQNVDVSGAMANVLLQGEQLARGVPEASMKASGMPNPTAAARAVMGDRAIEGGVGQKIADFVDSAEKKDVRSWMANHPSGGSPFVVDVHTGRDTGLVDDKLVNHLRRLGYNEEDLAKLKPDLLGSPTQAQYENRADFGRSLTKHLNDNNWMGRSNWTPREVQAVGWMGMTKLTADKAEDINTGLSRNMRHLSMELSPGEGSPWAKQFGERFEAISPQDRVALTHEISQDAIEHASKIAGINVRDIVHGTGGWQNFQNPSTVAQAFASKEGAEIAAHTLGHLLHQTEVWSNKIKPLTSTPKGFAVDFIASGNHNLHTDAGLRDFWQKVMDADPLKGTNKPLFEGYQPIRTPDGRVGLRALIDRGGLKTKDDLDKAVSGPIDQMIQSLPHDVQTSLHEAEITKARNDWKANPNGQAYSKRLVDLLGRDPTADLNLAGKELEKKFKAGLEKAEARFKEGATEKIVYPTQAGNFTLTPVTHDPFAGAVP